MADGTKIEWTDATANVINGCSLASPGCTNCYAMRLAGGRMKHHPTREGLTQDTKAGPVWTGEVRFHEPALQQVLRWQAPRMIFWNAHGDMFHPNVPDAWIDRCFAVMALTPQHTHQVLTKRSARMREYMASPARAALIACDATAMAGRKLGPTALVPPFPLPNVWLGVSVEDQVRADERIPDLLTTPAAVRWISAEPLLGPVDLNRIHEEFDGGLGHAWESCLNGKRFSEWGGDGHGGDLDGFPRIDWVVAGGESGPGARPMHPEWARSLRDQCAQADVPFLFKQWGEWLPAVSEDIGDRLVMWPDDGRDHDNDYSDWGRHPVEYLTGQEFWCVGKKRAGRLLDGIQHDGYPEVSA